MNKPGKYDYNHIQIVTGMVSINLSTFRGKFQVKHFSQNFLFFKEVFKVFITSYYIPFILQDSFKI